MRSNRAFNVTKTNQLFDDCANVSYCCSLKYLFSETQFQHEIRFLALNVRGVRCTYWNWFCHHPRLRQPFILFHFCVECECCKNRSTTSHMQTENPETNLKSSYIFTKSMLISLFAIFSFSFFFAGLSNAYFIQVFIGKTRRTKIIWVFIVVIRDSIELLSRSNVEASTLHLNTWWYCLKSCTCSHIGHNWMKSCWHVLTCFVGINLIEMWNNTCSIIACDRFALNSFFARSYFLLHRV